MMLRSIDYEDQDKGITWVLDCEYDIDTEETPSTWDEPGEGLSVDVTKITAWRCIVTVGPSAADMEVPNPTEMGNALLHSQSDRKYIEQQIAKEIAAERQLAAW